MTNALRRFLLSSTARRSPEIYRLAVEKRPLTAHERMQRAMAVSSRGVPWHGPWMRVCARRLKIKGDAMGRVGPLRDQLRPLVQAGLCNAELIAALPKSNPCASRCWPCICAARPA